MHAMPRETEFDRFAEVARETYEGAELNRVLTEIDHAAYRRGKLGREPQWSEHGGWAENDLCLFVFAMRKMVAEHDGVAPPADPLAHRRERMERRAAASREVAARREERWKREKEEAMRTPMQTPVERPVAAAKPSKPKKAAEPAFVDPRQMSLF